MKGGNNMMTFPSFHGLPEEDAAEFYDAFELACLVAHKDEDDLKLKIFPLVLKREAKWWYNGLDCLIKGNWRMLKKMFLERFQPKVCVQELLEALYMWKQEDLQSYVAYEEGFHSLWLQLKLHSEGSKTPDCVIKECFLNGLCSPLKMKVVYEMPTTLKEAVHVARVRYRKIMFKTYKVEVSLPQWEYKSPNVIVESPCDGRTNETVLHVIPGLCFDDCLQESSFKDDVFNLEVSVQKEEAALEQEKPQVEQQEEMEFALSSLVELGTEMLSSYESEDPTTQDDESELEKEDGFSGLVYSSDEDSVPERKGEGWLPPCENGSFGALFYDETDEDASSMSEVLLCRQSSMEATSEKLDMMFDSGDDEDCLLSSLFGSCDNLKMGDSFRPQLPKGDDMEMGDASCPLLFGCHAVEMGDASSIGLVLNTLPQPQDETGMEIQAMAKGLTITYFAMHALKVLVLKNGERSELVDKIGKPFPFLLPSKYHEMKTSAIDIAYDLEEYARECFLFSLICDVDANILHNEDKAMISLSQMRERMVKQVEDDAILMDDNIVMFSFELLKDIPILEETLKKTLGRTDHGAMVSYIFLHLAILWSTQYKVWDPGQKLWKYDTDNPLAKGEGYDSGNYGNFGLEDLAQGNLVNDKPLGLIAQDPFLAQHVPCISCMSIGPITRPCIDTFLSNPGTPMDYLSMIREDECTSRLQGSIDLTAFEQEA